MTILRKAYYAFAIVSVVVMITQIFLPPLRVELLALASVGTLILAIKIWPGTIRDEMDGIGDLFMTVMSLFLFAMVAGTWWGSKNEAIRHFWVTLQHWVFA